jgi:recombination protein RecA
MYNEGISRTGSVIDLGVDHGILEKKGAWISHEGELIGQGREAAKQSLADSPELLASLTEKILEKVEVSVGSVLAKGDEDS